MDRLVKEVDGIETVQQLRDALIEFHPDMKIGDAFGEPLHLALREDTETDERFLDLR